MVKNIVKLFLAIIALAWIIGVIIVPNPTLCFLSSCPSLNSRDFVPFIAYKGFLLTFIPTMYLGFLISKEFNNKLLKNLLLNFLIIYLTMLVATTVMHRDEFFSCDYQKNIGQKENCETVNYGI